MYRNVSTAPLAVDLRRLKCEIEYIEGGGSHLALFLTINQVSQNFPPKTEFCKDSPSVHVLLMSRTKFPNALAPWQIKFHLRPMRTPGKWVPESEHSEAKLLSLPYAMTTRQVTTSKTCNPASQVSSSDGPPDVLAEESHLPFIDRQAQAHSPHNAATQKASDLNRPPKPN